MVTLNTRLGRTTNLLRQVTDQFNIREYSNIVSEVSSEEMDEERQDWEDRLDDNGIQDESNYPPDYTSYGIE